MKKSYDAMIILRIIFIVSILMESVPCLSQGMRKTNTDHIKRKWLDLPYASQSMA